MRYFQKIHFEVGCTCTATYLRSYTAKYETLFDLLHDACVA